MTRVIPIDARLEDNYNNMARRTDAPELLRQWSERSERYRRNADAVLDCAYGSGDRERIDIFRCGEQDAPLYVYIHGGYWQRGDKSMYSFVAEPFIESKVDVALIGYPLCPQVSMTQLVDCIRNAIAFLYRNADSLGISATRLNLSGHSAGGHLTAMGLCTDWPELDRDLPENLVKTGIPLSGLYQLKPLLHTSICDALHLTDDEVDSLSPGSLVPAQAAPLLVSVGGAESDEFFTQADRFIEQWSRHGLTLEKHIEPDVDHFDLVNRLASRDSEIFRRINAWLK